MNECDAKQWVHTERESSEQVSEEGEFARAVGVKLAAPVMCPDTAWKTALEQVSRVQQRERRRLVWRRAAVLALASAAVFLLVTGGYFYSQSTPPPRPLFLTLDEHTIEGLEAKAEVSDGVAVRALLQNLSLPVALDPNNTLSSKDTSYRFIGARREQYDQDQAVELLFDHMGKPAILVIALRTGAIAKEINKKYNGNQGMYATRDVGDVVIAAVGAKEAGAAHAPDDLLMLFSDPQPVPASATPSDETASSSSPDETSSILEGIVPQAEPSQEPPTQVLEPITPESEPVPQTPVDTLVPDEVKQII
ncbi:MAG TPA: hypothetical protein PLI09_12975 [Candidatus Hydrogenedentes bacterium]|nr:hypothetical protein [Candidatus Hydrogenedentota bacterium]